MWHNKHAEAPIASPTNVQEGVVRKTWRQKIESIVWDGSDRTKEEKALVQTLDIFIL